MDAPDAIAAHVARAVQAQLDARSAELAAVTAANRAFVDACASGAVDDWRADPASAWLAPLLRPGAPAPAWVDAAPAPPAARFGRFDGGGGAPLEAGWRADGHSFVGREVTRAHGEARAEALSEGLVVAWLPATASDPFLDGDGQPAPLFKVLFRGGGLAGEEEDLEEAEVEECLSDLPDGDVSDDPGWRSRPWCRVLAKPGPLAKFEPGADRGGLAERRLDRVPGLPPYMAFTALSRSMRVDDDPVLRFTPYLGENADAADIIDGYDMAARQRELDAKGACPAWTAREARDALALRRACLGGVAPTAGALSAAVDALFDVEERRRSPGDALEDAARLRRARRRITKKRDDDEDALVAADLAREAAGRKANLRSALLELRDGAAPPPPAAPAPKLSDAGHARYEDDVDSTRKLLCRRCFTFDCNVHGNLAFAEDAAPRGPDAGDVFPAPRPLACAPAPPLFAGAARFEVARALPVAAAPRPWTARDDRLLPRALAVFGGCASRTAAALGVDGEGLRRAAARAGLAVAGRAPGTWCCDRCGPRARPADDDASVPSTAGRASPTSSSTAGRASPGGVEEAPAPSPAPSGRASPTPGGKKRKRGKSKAADALKKGKFAAPHPERRFVSRAIETAFVFCRHEGPCTYANCECVRNDTYCTKFCGCAVKADPPRDLEPAPRARCDLDDHRVADWLKARRAGPAHCADVGAPPPRTVTRSELRIRQACSNQFHGCDCKRGDCSTRACPCFAAGRECDPDACGACGAARPRGDCCDPGDLRYRHAGRRTRGADAGGGGRGAPRCRNRDLALGRACRVALAPSGVPGAGWGLFAPEGAAKGALITEYVGERISQTEAERRGKIQDKVNCSYLFNLDEDTVVDARRYGNKARFANHADHGNCATRTVLVDGTHRIGIYAKAAVEPHAELFFDYRYTVEEETDGQRKAAVLVDWMADGEGKKVSKSTGARLLEPGAAAKPPAKKKPKKGPGRPRASL